MQCATTPPQFTSPTTHFTTRRPLLRRHSLSYTRATMSTTIEHIVLFNIKPTANTTQLSTMLTALNSLTTLPMVLHLSAGKLHRNRSSSLSFTHLLHSRYRTKQDLADYSSHPDHLSAVRTCVLPICDDLMAVDWVAENLDGPIGVKPGSAIRVQLIKLKEDVEEGKKGEVIQVISGLKGSFSGIEQLTVGENFSPERAKGFEICSIGVFGGIHELDSLETNSDIGNEKDKVRDSIDSLVIVDYVVPNRPASV
ncbi:stress-response A/B barrel domain-containing protein UP3-like [Chenopodium quinoa]|nr:stress-response A/B barrel domain-containing protein UP3-like [Chenopodium quinoa]